MRKRIKLGAPSHSTVVAYLALLLAISGTAYAANHLPKNSVGSKQLKKNSVTKQKVKKNAIVTAKIKNQAIIGAKVKDGTLTGKQVNASTLGTVPTAQTANTLAPGEAWHILGAPGEPAFENSWANIPAEGPLSFDSAAFYKDQEGIVHLRGIVKGGTSSIIFHLPPGYRPATGKVIFRLTLCSGGGCAVNDVRGMIIGGSGIPTPGVDGVVTAPGGAGSTSSLEGITFRAES
jgi:hypothetical protein